MLESAVLVLNKSYLPIHVTTVKRAFCMLFSGIARVVDQEYRTFDFHSWAELGAQVDHESVGLVNRVVRVPRVILLVTYDRFPRRTVKFSRLNILLRDKHVCQYCGIRFPRAKLNLDHVIPRSRGGLTTWENIVTSCHECNRRKGGLLPEEAGIKLIHKPFRPKTVPFLGLTRGGIRFEEWKPFLNVVDYSYWNVELEE
jgi:5-methylcytosine-specific restriction endonuclease McrA